ncbi:MAG TPA: NHL repeat-containing protein [Planctomycetaceae bacterium]|nr:NHL repeat-containing protein [Planctomycetaceae bacterium]
MRQPIAIGWLFFVACLPVADGQEPQPVFLKEWGKKGTAAGEFSSPIGIAFTPQNELFITDLNNARVQKFATDGRHLGGFNLPHDKPERRSTIIGGIAIDEAGLLYLTYMVQHKVGVYRENGELVREFGKQGAGDGEFHQPGGLLFPSPSTVLIADQCNHRVQLLQRDGTYLSQWGQYGEGDGEFDGIGNRGGRFGGPHFLARDSQGRIYTTEGIQGRVQVFTADGKFLMKWGDKGDQPGGFGAYPFGNLPHTFGPIGIVVDRYGRVYVSSLNNRVQCFSPTGQYLFGITGTGKEGGDLDHPHGVAFDKDGHLYICDGGAQRILKFSVPAPVKP